MLKPFILKKKFEESLVKISLLALVVKGLKQNHRIRGLGEHYTVHCTVNPPLYISICRLSIICPLQQVPVGSP